MNCSFAALVLAAGESIRMGQPKAALSLYGAPLLEQHVRAYTSSGLTPVAVVLGHQAETLLERLDLSTALVVLNCDYHCGQFSSVRAGLRALNELSRSDTHLAGVFLTPVDCPPVPASLITRMQEHLLSAGDTAAVIPCYRGKPGHPVLLGPDTLQAALQAAPDDALDRLLSTFGTRVSQLELTEPAILWNLNFPEDLARYLQSNPLPVFHRPNTET